ncbi:hypothetical protein L3C95_19290 [Chitinophaga filiformis]|uniref:HYR-like domain-containing protein n=1 Tax=Chitinophaga filiformis TaxID=104663 RepID=UPI001F17DF93|nr:hypothetical protein [Chitinophaga filiformis]MCF6405055.1 hypothetical protein [Chitinophaga filiformis]
MNEVFLLFRSILRAVVRRTRVPILLALPLLLLQLTAHAQSANLDQGANEKATAPVTPVDWINGNLNANQAHFLEGYSVPYRAILEDLVVNQTYTLVIGLDVRNSGKHALDYITHFQRLDPHNVFSHGPETVNPLLDAPEPASYFTTTDVYTIPAPSSAGSPKPGQPTNSFNLLSAGEQLFTGYNVDITNISYASEGSLTATNSETVINITFKALKATAILAWGGHIASIVDWGKDPVTGEPNSASAINGSPYHMRLKNWIINGNVVSIGNQDRSLKTDAVFIPPTCDVTGPVTACVETTKLTYVATVDDPTGLTYLWSIIGANTANAKIVNATLGTIEVVPIGAAFTPGSFNLQLIVTREGLKDTCYLNSHENPGAAVIISQVIANAGADQTITHLDVANLSASAAGGDGTYTFSWTPTTGLSDPNIANPVFTPPSTGVFEFVVKADDGQCSDVDTVIITVTEHPKPPCGIDGPSPVCPGSQNEYSGPDPSLVGTYLWSVTGDGAISGVNNTQKVLIDAAKKCGALQLRLIVSTPDGKRKDTCYLDVIIKDSIKPVLTGQASDANVACARDVPAPPAIGVTDDCTAELKVETSSTVFDSTCVNRFKIIRKWWATDLCGNTSDTLTQTITIHDDVKPVITADFDKTVNVQCLKDVPAAPKPTATDNCNGEVTPVYTETGSGTACDSTITRKWVFTDACGNSDSVTQVINIKDDIKPILSGSADDINVTCSKDIPAAGNISATDNCDATPAVDFSQTTIDSTCVNNFKVIRKWWAKDACGNTSDTLTQIITVHDDVKPVITADFEKTVNVQCLKDVPVAPKPTATDNCNGDVTPVYTETGSGTACDSTITRKWVFTDACGNSDSVTQVINIKDDIKPILSGSADDINVTCSKDIPAAGNISATDNCDATPAVDFSQTTIDSTCVNNFKVIRKWWAKDACGNTSDTLTQIITVHDDVKPVITADFEKTVKVQCLKDVPAAPKPTATDNCNGEVTPVYTETGSGTACDSTITRKWVFTDACGNSDSVTQVINIKDDIKPILSGSADDINVTCSKDIPAAGNISATDNCDATPAVDFSQTTIDSTCVNNFKVIRKWWAKDACGNTSDTLTQTITVHDDVKPVITADFDKTVNVQCLKDVPAAPKPTATDNCNGEVTPVYTETGSGTACDSTITRKWVFTDACGNKDSVSQVINIKDDIKPILSGSADDINVTCSKDIPAAGNISATDNCDATPAVDFSQTTIDSTCVNNFKVIRKWWAKDACGNTSDTLTQIITVHDDVKPVITADFDKVIDVQCLKDVPAPPRPTATDNCDGDLAADCSATGSGTACDSTIIRKWVFTDACGNSDSVTQVIHIKDNIKPILSGSVNNVNVACYKDIPAAAGLSATDNCTANPVIHFSQKSFDSTCVNRLKIIRKWWAEDACGNTSDTLKQLITVYDNVKPVITANCHKIVYVQCPKDIPAAPKPTATDNCNGSIQPVFSQKGFGCACDSVIARKWVFADACGNKDSVMQLILIKDITAPVVTYKPANMTVATCASPVVFGTPVFSDNCGTVKVTYVDRKEGTSCPIRHIRKWTAKDKCNNSVSVEQAITVPCCQGKFCTYTQGFYGNVKGLACTPSGTSVTAAQIMSAAVDAQAGDSVIFGLKLTGKYFTLFLGDITNGNIFKMLPGGGTPAALKGYATFNKSNTWPNVPLLTTTSNFGKINNVLLSQTMSLFFNMHLTATLKNLTIEGDTLKTAKLTACGSNTPTTTVSNYVIPPSVVNYLKSIGKANIAGLHELANMYLGGQTIPGVAIGDVSKAVDAINNAFDKCAVLVGWTKSSAITTLKVSTTTLSVNDPKATEARTEEAKLNVTVFPNPYNDKLIFRFIAPVSGQVKLEVYNLLGQQIGQLNYGMVDKGTQHTIEYHVPAIHRDVLVYKLSVGDLIKTGKAIHAKE